MQSAAAGNGGVTVITVTRRRPELARRAISSVRRQDYRGRIEHLIVVDECSSTMTALADINGTLDRQLVLLPVPRAAGDGVDHYNRIVTVYPRIARLLNIGIQVAGSPWIAFLDDDNEYEPCHISSLVAVAARYGYSAVHSYRQVLYADGSPYLEPRFPWTTDPAEAARIFQLLCQRGVWAAGTNILRDRAGPLLPGPFRNSTVISPADPVYLVDTSVWLLERALLMRHPVPEKFTRRDVQDGTAPDDKLLEVLLMNGVRIATNGLPSVRYYLGGVSNSDRHLGQLRPGQAAVE